MVHLGKGKIILQAPNRKEGRIFDHFHFVHFKLMIYVSNTYNSIDIYNSWLQYYIILCTYNPFSGASPSTPPSAFNKPLFCRASDLQVDQLCKGLRQTICHSLARRMLIGICRSWQLLSVRYHIIVYIQILIVCQVLLSFHRWIYVSLEILIGQEGFLEQWNRG